MPTTAGVLARATFTTAVVTLVAFAALFRIPEYWELFTIVMITAVVAGFCTMLFGIAALLYPAPPREWALRAALVLTSLGAVLAIGWIVSHLQAH